MAKKATQQQLASILGESQQAIQKLIDKGVLTRGATIGQWLVEYGKHMRKVAAGWQSEGGLDLIEERAALAKAQRQKIEFDLAKSRDEFRSVRSLRIAHGFLVGATRAKLLALPSRFRSATAGVTAAQYAALDSLVREILTELSETRVPAEISQQMAEIDQKHFEESTTINGNGNGKIDPALLPRNQ